jgi:hypothetical protein
VDFRRFGGTLYHRTAFAGATTGQQLMYALDEQVRRYESQGLVEKYEYWEFLSLVLDDNGQTRGVSAMNVWDRKIEVFRADAVILCTGGPGIVFGKSTNSVINTGAAASRAYQQGVWYGNGEFIQVHPTSIPGADKLRLISESVRGEGGRVWVPMDANDRREPLNIPEGDRDYFLERKYPKFGNLVPRDVATREIFHMCTVEKRGVDGENQVYLDITPAQSKQSAEALEQKLGGVLEIYRKFVGDDPIKTPMRIFPGMHYSMGGIWVSPRDGEGHIQQMTNVPGTFAAGECEFQYHGANRLGANSLLSCIYGGGLAGKNAVEYVKASKAVSSDAPFESEKKRQEDIAARILRTQGGHRKRLPHWQGTRRRDDGGLYRRPREQEAGRVARQAGRAGRALEQRGRERHLRERQSVVLSGALPEGHDHPREGDREVGPHARRVPRCALQTRVRIAQARHRQARRSGQPRGLSQVLRGPEVQVERKVRSPRGQGADALARVQRVHGQVGHVPRKLGEDHHRDVLERFDDTRDQLSRCRHDRRPATAQDLQVIGALPVSISQHEFPKVTHHV